MTMAQRAAVRTVKINAGILARLQPLRSPHQPPEDFIVAAVDAHKSQNCWIAAEPAAGVTPTTSASSTVPSRSLRSEAIQTSAPR